MEAKPLERVRYPADAAGEEPRRVLIVDDDRDFAESMQDLLEARGYVTRIAYDSDSALHALTTFPAEVALLDIRIGLHSGIDLLKLLGRRAPELLCVMITAYCSADTAIEALRRGAYDYLAKPVRAEVLTAALERCFETLDLRRERDLAQAHLHCSERRYRQLVEDSSAVPWEYDAHSGRFLYIGRRIEGLTGVAVERWLEPGFLLQRVHADDAEQVRSLFAHAAAGRHGEIEFRLQVDAGQPLWLRCHVGGAEAGESGLVFGYLFDVTEQVLGRQQQQRLQRQLQQAQRMEAIGYLAGGVAHDFNNILASMLGYTGLALERIQRDPTSVTRYLQEVRSAGDKARRLVQGMLAFSRGGTGESIPLALGAALQEALRLVRPSLPAGMGVDTHFPSVEQRVLMDPVQLQQVVMNLCLNARDACGDRGVITLEVTAARNYIGECASCHRPFKDELVAITVSDNGSGMEAELLTRVFDPFFTTKALGKGSGLGLSIVHGIVHDFGGHLLVDSRPGAGTRFRVLLPVLPVSAADRTAPERPDVILVEDDRAAARLFQQALEAAGHVTVHYAHAASLLAAPQVALTAPLIVADQSLPELTGLELLQRLHAAGRRLPTLLYTRDARLLDEPQREGIARIIPRPMQGETLVAAVGTLLQESARQ